MIVSMLPSTILALISGLVSTQGLYARFPRAARRPAAHGNPFLSIEPSSSLIWTPCFENSPASRMGAAPLDYTKNSAGHVELAIVKLSGSGAGDGVFYNPGGPGDDPIEDILNNAPLLRAYTDNNSDIIGITPRGVGATFPPVSCDKTELSATRRQWEIDNTLPGYDRYSLSESYAIGESLGLDCSLTKPDLVPYVGTVSAARDMEFVRKALGQEYLN